MLSLLEVSNATMANSTLCDGILVPNQLFNIVSVLIKGIRIAVPVLLIIFGMMDFAKSVIAKKEEDVKKHQQAFVKRLISAVIVFLLIWVVQFVVNVISGVEDKTNDSGQTVSDIWSCSRKFINGVDNDTTTSNK